MSRGTVTLPSRTYPLLPARRTPGLPDLVPGGAVGPVEVPSRLATAVLPPVPGQIVPGGHIGQVKLFTPAVDKAAPYYLGANEGHSIRTVDGSPLTWLRRIFTNNAGVEAFTPPNHTPIDWTSNEVRRGALTPGSPIPVNNKMVPHVAIRRAAYQDEQLFSQLTDRRHPWPIQKPVPFHLRAQLRGQPIQTRPYWPRLSRYIPAASYSQTTATLISQALTNVLPQAYGNNPTQAGGSPYGSY